MLFVLCVDLRFQVLDLILSVLIELGRGLEVGVSSLLGKALVLAHFVRAGQFLVRSCMVLRRGIYRRDVVLCLLYLCQLVVHEQGHHLQFCRLLRVEAIDLLCHVVWCASSIFGSAEAAQIVLVVLIGLLDLHGLDRARLLFSGYLHQMLPR